MRWKKIGPSVFWRNRAQSTSNGSHTRKVPSLLSTPKTNSRFQQSNWCIRKLVWWFVVHWSRDRASALLRPFVPPPRCPCLHGPLPPLYRPCSTADGLNWPVQRRATRFNIRTDYTSTQAVPRAKVEVGVNVLNHPSPFSDLGPLP